MGKMEHQAQKLESYTDTSRHLHKNIPIERIEELRRQGMSYSQIASIVGCTKGNIFIRLMNKSNQDKIEDIDTFKENEALILSDLRKRIISSITDEDIKKASIQVKMMAYGIAYDKFRLETNQSTSNVESHVLNVNITQLSSELDKIQSRRKALMGKHNDNE